MQHWEATLPSAKELADEQRLADQFQDALSPLRWPGAGNALERVRTNFLAIGLRERPQHDVAAGALTNAVNQSLDIFESHRGEDATAALHFAKALIDESFQVGGRLSAGQRDQIFERVQALRPRDRVHSAPLNSLQNHLMLRPEPEVHLDTALAHHGARLDRDLEVILQGAFDDAFSNHWQHACTCLPLVNVEKQRVAVDQMADQLRQDCDEDEFREPLLDASTALLQVGSKLGDTKCRVLVLEMAAQVLGETGLNEPAAQLPLLLALGMKPLGSAPLPAQGGQALLGAGSRATRSLMECAFKHIGEGHDALREDAFFPRYMAAMESLVPPDAAAIHSRTRELVAHSQDQDTKVVFARLATQALYQLRHEPATFLEHATKLLDTLEQHLAAAPGVTPATAREHPTAKLFGELLELGKAAHGAFPNNPALALADTRVASLQGRMLPGLPSTTS